MYGTIKSSWKIDNDKITYSVSVPANATAIVYFPVSDKSNIKESGKSIRKWKNLSNKNTEVVLTLGSGSYNFQLSKG